MNNSEIQPAPLTDPVEPEEPGHGRALAAPTEAPIEAALLQPGDEFFDLLTAQYRARDRAALASGEFERSMCTLYMRDFGERIGLCGIKLLRTAAEWAERAVERARAELVEEG